MICPKCKRDLPWQLFRAGRHGMTQNCVFCRNEDLNEHGKVCSNPLCQVKTKQPIEMFRIKRRGEYDGMGYTLYSCFCRKCDKGDKRPKAITPNAGKELTPIDFGWGSWNLITRKA